MFDAKILQKQFDSASKLVAFADGAPLQKAISARFDNVTPGVCPYCSKEMKITTACDQQVYFCEQDRTVLPLPNDKLSSLPAIPQNIPFY